MIVIWNYRGNQAGDRYPAHLQGGAMFIECQSANPAVHRICIEIAAGCVNVIRPLLRQEEIHCALTEFYRVAREAIDKPPGREEEV